MEPIRIAVFGDTHGHLRLMFQLCRLWQLEHGLHLDLVVQCGDLGFFPDEGLLDRATRRYVRKDPEEIAFARFFRKQDPVDVDPLLERILRGPPDSLETVRSPVVWCHGNHEDFLNLNEAAGRGDLEPVDRFGALLYVQSGSLIETALASGGARAPAIGRVLGLRNLERTRGRISPAGAEPLGADPWAASARTGPRLGFVGGGPEPEGMPDDDGGAFEPLGWVGWQACERLTGTGVDVLISHCAPRGVVGPGHPLGSPRLRQLLDAASPAYLFFSHHSKPIPSVTLGQSRCVWLQDVNFERDAGPGPHPFGYLEAGCMGLLEWHGRDEHHFSVVDEAWMDQVRWSSWRHL